MEGVSSQSELEMNVSWDIILFWSRVYVVTALVLLVLGFLIVCFREAVVSLFWTSRDGDNEKDLLPTRSSEELRLVVSEYYIRKPEEALFFFNAFDLIDYFLELRLKHNFVKAIEGKKVIWSKMQCLLLVPDYPEPTEMNANEEMTAKVGTQKALFLLREVQTRNDTQVYGDLVKLKHWADGAYNRRLDDLAIGLRKGHSRDKIKRQQFGLNLWKETGAYITGLLNLTNLIELKGFC